MDLKLDIILNGDDEICSLNIMKCYSDVSIFLTNSFLKENVEGLELKYETDSVKEDVYNSTHRAYSDSGQEHKSVNNSDIGQRQPFIAPGMGQINNPL